MNSQGKFYLLVEYDKSGLTVGNFQTQVGSEDASKIVKYNRTLYGGKIALESTRKTVYGEPMTKASMFAAEANQHSGHVEFLATGGSLYSIPQAPFKDYLIKYDEGHIIFN